MRRFCLIGLVWCASVAGAAPVEHAGSYVGWGGEGGQVFRHKISLLRNHKYSERAMLIVVDDLPRRGPRFGIARVTVEYTGGAEASDRLLKAIHQKPYQYVLVRMYEVPQSPRIARIVLPQATGVKATIRFHHTVQRGITGENAKAMAAELTRTLDCDMLRELPIINPLKDPTVRKPRNGQEDVAPELRMIEESVPEKKEEEETQASAPLPPTVAPAPAQSRTALAPGLPPPPPGFVAGSDVNVPAVTVPAAPLDPNDPRIEATRQWAKQVAAEIRLKEAERARTPRRVAPAGPGIDVEDAPSDRNGLDYDEDTPEMREAERRAARLEQAVVIRPSDGVVQ